eukprot:COSAG01_NODE_24641_length_772_cov_0.958395_1_plen_80_part_00
MSLTVWLSHKIAATTLLDGYMRILVGVTLLHGIQATRAPCMVCQVTGAIRVGACRIDQCVESIILRLEDVFGTSFHDDD